MPELGEGVRVGCGAVAEAGVGGPEGAGAGAGEPGGAGAGEGERAGATGAVATFETGVPPKASIVAGSKTQISG